MAAKLGWAIGQYRKKTERRHRVGEIGVESLKIEMAWIELFRKHFGRGRMGVSVEGLAASDFESFIFRPRARAAAGITRATFGVERGRIRRLLRRPGLVLDYPHRKLMEPGTNRTYESVVRRDEQDDREVQPHLPLTAPTSTPPPALALNGEVRGYLDSILSILARLEARLEGSCDEATS